MVVRRVAREHLRELRARTGRTVSLGVLGGIEVAYVDRWRGSRQGQYTVDLGIGLGTRVPVHCSAAGKALLARLPAAKSLSAGRSAESRGRQLVSPPENRETRFS
jgi:DNA-binding IclR family transcriptional regulator